MEKKAVVRALNVVRLSVLTDESTSPERQLEHGRNAMKARSVPGGPRWEEVGVASDLDVSATKYSPFKRPELGDWLNNRAHEFDAIVVWRLDRIVRSSKDLADLITWCDSQKPPKTLVSATEGFDLGTPFGKAMVAIIAALAELEAGTLSTRITDSHKALSKLDRWPAGQPPYGYKVVDHPVSGKTLDFDPVTSKVVRRMGLMYLEGQSQLQIARLLNEEKRPTGTQWAHKEESSKRRGEISTNWTQSRIGKILANPVTQGFKTLGQGSARRLARGADGMPIRFTTEGIFTEDEWSRIQAALKERAVKRERRHGASPLLGIVYGGEGCGHRLYRFAAVAKKNGNHYSYCRCSKGCAGFSFEEKVTQQILDEHVALELESVPVTEKVLIPGEDHTEEVETVSRAMTGIRDEKDLGFYDYEGGEEEYRQRMEALVEKRKALQALPHRPARIEHRPTGETYAEAYLRMNAEERRALLLKGDIRLYMTSLKPPIHRLHVPEDLPKRLSA